MLTAAKTGGQPRSVDGRGAELTFRGLAFGIIEILTVFGVFIKVIIGFLAARAKAGVKQIARLYDFAFVIARNFKEKFKFITWLYIALKVD